MLSPAPSSERRDPVAESLKVPPYSVEAEQSTLGGLMIDNSAWDQIADRLGEDDFYQNDHKLIYRAIRNLAQHDAPFDVVTLAEWLERNNQLEEAGGLAYLGLLARDTPSASRKVSIDTERNSCRTRELLRIFL